MVNKEKQEKIKQFYRLEDSIRSLFAELIVRKTVCQKFNIPNSEVEFYCNEFGKPFLAGTIDFNFNVSHSSEWIVCAVGNQGWRKYSKFQCNVYHLQGGHFFINEQVQEVARLINYILVESSQLGLGCEHFNHQRQVKA